LEFHSHSFFCFLNSQKWIAIMVVNTGFVAAALALANVASALPSYSTPQMSVYKQANLTWTIDQRMMAAFDCRGQSCLIADTAGSTGRNPTMKAEGAGDTDIQCIIKHNPVVGQFLTAYNNKVPDVPSQSTTWMSSAMSGLNNFARPFSTARETGSFTGTCTPNILIYAKGTMEPTAYGITVGPQITRGLADGWSTVAVDYDPDVAGDYCLGLPGGMVARDTINGAVEKCPNSQIFLSGYSQGAMVVRNGLARASDQAKQQVKVRSCSFQFSHFWRLIIVGRHHIR
jgi:hypothetical protein